MARVLCGRGAGAELTLDRLEQAARDLGSAGRARWGQVFTPAPLARFLVSLWDEVPSTVRILDPGAGVGMLGVAAALHARARGARVALTAVEPEPRAAAVLSDVLGDLAGVQTTWVPRDFLAAPPAGPFDLVIANPPWFKLSPRDPRGGTAPNAYARFLEVSAGLLAPGGQLLFLVPRSYTSGRYFRSFRQRLHARVTLERAHVFGSRTATFTGVLQETLAVRYRHGGGGPVRLSGSPAAPTAPPELLEVPRHLVEAHDRLVLPTTPADLEVVQRLHARPGRLAALGLHIRTGPVVPFRTDALRDAEGDTVPLLWMQHVTDAGVRWPLPGFRKPQYILADASPKLLRPNRTCVLLRRFSAKEQARRLVVSVLRAHALPGAHLGFENHVNVIDGFADDRLADWLATVLRSDEVDTWFRVANGHTQVNAEDIRALPLPPQPRLATM